MIFGVKWIDEAVLIELHDLLIEQYGGRKGMLNAQALASALVRPRNRQAYDDPDIAELAALYGSGIAKAHAFIDGNKRAGYVALELFLDINGYAFGPPDDDAEQMMHDVAAGTISDDDFITWVRRHAVERG